MLQMCGSSAGELAGAGCGRSEFAPFQAPTLNLQCHFGRFGRSHQPPMMHSVCASLSLQEAKTTRLEHSRSIRTALDREAMCASTGAHTAIISTKSFTYVYNNIIMYISERLSGQAKRLTQRDETTQQKKKSSSPPTTPQNGLRTCSRT